MGYIGVIIHLLDKEIPTKTFICDWNLGWGRLKLSGILGKFSGARGWLISHKVRNLSIKMYSSSPGDDCSWFSATSASRKKYHDDILDSLPFFVREVWMM